MFISLYFLFHSFNSPNFLHPDEQYNSPIILHYIVVVSKICVGDNMYFGNEKRKPQKNYMPTTISMTHIPICNTHTPWKVKVLLFENGIFYEINCISEFLNLNITKFQNQNHLMKTRFLNTQSFRGTLFMENDKPMILSSSKFAEFMY